MIQPKGRHGEVISLKQTGYLSPFLLSSTLVRLGFIEFAYFFNSVFLYLYNFCKAQTTILYENFWCLTIINWMRSNPFDLICKVLHNWFWLTFAVMPPTVTPAIPTLSSRWASQLSKPGSVANSDMSRRGLLYGIYKIIGNAWGMGPSWTPRNDSQTITPHTPRAHQGSRYFCCSQKAGSPCFTLKSTVPLLCTLPAK